MQINANYICVFDNNIIYNDNNRYKTTLLKIDKNLIEIEIKIVKQERN